MDWSNTASAVVPSLDGAVFAVLAGTTRPLTGREVARLARRGSRSGVQRVLNRLDGHGLVTVTNAGPAHLYTLNREHVAAPAVLALQDLRGQLFSRTLRALADWDPAPRAAAVFGSAARGDGGLESDIDLLVIRPADVRDDDLRWADQVDALAQDVRRWSGNAASIIQVTSDEMVAMVESGEPVAEELRLDKVDLTEASVFSVLTESGA